MKNVISLILIITSFNSFSQINSPNDGNIFSYNGLADVTFKFTDRGSGGRAFVHDNYNVLSLNYSEDFTGGTRIGKDVYFKDGGNSFIASGNFGIGTVNPIVKLEVNSGDVAAFFKSALNSVPVSVINTGTAISTIGFKGSTSINEFNVRVGVDGNDFVSYTANVERMRINSNGNVGIGTTKPDSKLTVTGNIHAQEVKVTINAGVVPDYVFANDYKLKSLQEVEDYVKQNSHLPEIPSASEIEKNGLMLAEMNLSLLKKMEEMTLYMIEQNKQITDLKSRLEKVEAGSK